jgi:hypothetical protein
LVEALGQDHLNDVKTNSIGMASAIIGGKIASAWWMDSGW